MKVAVEWEVGRNRHAIKMKKAKKYECIDE